MRGPGLRASAWSTEGRRAGISGQRAPATADVRGNPELGPAQCAANGG